MKVQEQGVLRAAAPSRPPSAAGAKVNLRATVRLHTEIGKDEWEDVTHHG